jgi:hypothetical protein
MIIHKINRFLEIYNGTIYQTTGVSPSQMQSNKDLEVDYIINSINKQNKREDKTLEFKLNANDKVD